MNFLSENDLDVTYVLITYATLNNTYHQTANYGYE